MHKFAVFAMPLLLVGCADEAAEEPVAEETAAVEEAAPAMVTGNGSMPGTYTVTAADGTTSTSVLNADGTFQDMDAAGAVVNEGTWEVVDGKSCFTGTDGTPECWTESAPGADGSFTATSDVGDVVTVSPAATE